MGLEDAAGLPLRRRRLRATCADAPGCLGFRFSGFNIRVVVLEGQGRKPVNLGGCAQSNAAACMCRL